MIRADEIIRSMKADIESLVEKKWELQRELHSKYDVLSQLDSALDEVRRKIRSLRRMEIDAPSIYFDNMCTELLKKGIKAPKLPLQEPEQIEVISEREGQKSGIYFAWCSKTGKLQYVGKAKLLCNRLNPRRRELKDCLVSVFTMPEDEIHLAELFYIYAMQPERNHEVRKSKSEEDRFEYPEDKDKIFSTYKVKEEECTKPSIDDAPEGFIELYKKTGRFSGLED